MMDEFYGMQTTSIKLKQVNFTTRNGILEKKTSLFRNKVFGSYYAQAYWVYYGGDDCTTIQMHF